MKKNYIFYTLFFLFSFSINSQVVIGDGDILNSSVPIEAYYGYSYSQTIYKSSQINASGSITGVSYSATPSTTLTTSGQWVVYVGLTEKETFESTSDWIPISELSQVYAATAEAPTTISEEGVVTITFDAPFEYDGSSNLVIAVEENQDGYDSSSDDFYSSEANQIASIYYYSDGVNPDPTDPPVGNITQRYPNVVLEGITQDCPNPTGFSRDSFTATSATISWEAGSAEAFEYVYSDTEPEGAGESISSSTVTVDNLDSETTEHTVWVRSVCGDIASAWISYTFSNLCPMPVLNSWTMTQDGAVFNGIVIEGAVGYQIEYSTEMFVPGDGTATVYDFYEFPNQLSGLEGSTTYYFTLRTVCGDGFYSDWSDNGNDGPDEWTTQGLTCEPAANCTVGDGFTSLVFGDIDNSESGCSNTGFGNFTDLSTDLAQGETYDVTMTTGYGNQYVRAWVDFNDDYIYTADELVLDNYIIGEGLAAGTHTGTAQFTIPAEATLGSHYIRFKSNWNAVVPDDPCEATTYGETEEYTVNIVESLGISDVDLLNLRIYPNPVDGNTVTILSSVSGDKFVEVFDINGRKVISTKIFNDDLDVSNLVSGFYTTRVTIAGKTSVSKLIVK
jgi:hypothetical protein